MNATAILRLPLVCALLGALAAPALHALDLTCELERAAFTYPNPFLGQNPSEGPTIVVNTDPSMGTITVGANNRIILVSPYAEGQTIWTRTPADGGPTVTLSSTSRTLVLTFPSSFPAITSMAGVYHASSTNPTETAATSRSVTIAAQRMTMPLTAVSNRVYLAANQPPPITGFVVEQPDLTLYPNNESRYVLVRAVGPTLANYGVPGTLAAPRIEIYNAAGSRQLPMTALSSVDPISMRQDIAKAVSSVGAFPLLANGNEFTDVYYLPAGSYSAVLSSGQANATGTALIEIWPLESFSYTARGTTGPFPLPPAPPEGQ